MLKYILLIHALLWGHIIQARQTNKEEKGAMLTAASGYLARSKEAQNNTHYEEGKQWATKAVAAFTPLNMPDSLGESYVMLWSNSSLLDAPLEERVILLDKAATAFIMSGNKKRQADCLMQMGDILQVNGQWGRAYPILKKSLELYQAAGHLHLQASYDLLNTVSFMLGDYETAIRYGLLAARTADEVGDTSMMLCTIYNRIGLAYMETDKDKARTYFERSLAIAVKYNDLNNMTYLIYNYVDMLLKTDKPQEALHFAKDMLKKHPRLVKDNKIDVACIMINIYLWMNAYTEARPYKDIIENEINKGIDSYRIRANVIRRLFLYYLGTGENAKAAVYADMYTAFCQKIQIGIYKADELMLRFKLDSATGHYLTAIQYFQRYKEAKDSAFNEKKSKQVSQLNIFFETEKKNKDILVLQKQSELQKSNLRQAAIIRNIILAGVAVLLLVVFLLYKGYRLKQRNNQVLEQHQEEIAQKNESLQRLVTEKEWLLKEIHHRVKNNLHMVVGLLASQTEYLKGQEAFDAISESQHRIQSMSLIHQKLYQTENLSAIDMPSYIMELVEYLQSSFDRKRPVRFKLNITKVEFPLSHSIPIGLILNEAITNAFKYAFPDNRSGEINISLLETQNNQYILTIKDDGIGLPEGFDAQKSQTLGSTLMHGLSDDIQASFQMYNDHGTTIEISFTIENHQPQTLQELSL